MLVHWCALRVGPRGSMCHRCLRLCYAPTRGCCGRLAGTSARAGGASYLGADECACCAGSRKVRDPASGACAEAVDPGEGSWGPAWGLEGPESANGSAAPRLLGSVLAACCSVWLFGL